MVHFHQLLVDSKHACSVKLALQMLIEEIEEGVEDGPTANVASEVTITEARAKFTGTYSDIHVGRFRNQTVRL
jgi:hypothetical protein